MNSVYSVGQINTYIKNMFAQDYLLKNLSVKGEVSNLKYHSSGHIYFTLKDETNTIACVMFAGNRSGLSFKLAEGQSVVIAGTVDVYTRDGKYQFYAKKITLSGDGELYERFERLKADMLEKGMFDDVYKQTIPRYIKRLGVVTAATGAAVQDIINITKRRNPYVQICLYPAIVQGEDAVQSIVKGINMLDQAGMDVIIVGRGGGSIEDLWAFNCEPVAEAVFNAKTPIISAVGHETDTTICDFVADLRAPTPSAAAELAVHEYSQLMDDINQYKNRMNHLFQIRLEEYRHRLSTDRLKLESKNPQGVLRERRMRLVHMEDTLKYLMDKKLLKPKKRYELYLTKMEGLSPLLRMKQGYSFVTDDKGRQITCADKLIPGDKVNIKMYQGQVEAKVIRVQP